MKPASSQRDFLIARSTGAAYLSCMKIRLRAMGIGLDDEHRAQARGKLDLKLAKFASSIERVDLRVFDLNGPRGGVDQVCRVNS